MSESVSDVLPCLKEFTWAGREQTVCRALWQKEPSPSMPWLAFGYDHPHSFDFISTERLPELQLTEEALEAQALTNLRNRPAAWQPVNVEVSNGKRLEMLVGSADFFAAEQILNTEFMQDAQRRLNARGVIAGIPRRGVLLATAVDQDEEQIAAFGALVADEFSRAESAVISPMVFALEDGAIVSTRSRIAVRRTERRTPTKPTPTRTQTRTPTPTPAPMFSWWTGLPSWVRLLVGLVIGLIVLNRIMIELAISLLP